MFGSGSAPQLSGASVALARLVPGQRCVRSYAFLWAPLLLSCVHLSNGRRFRSRQRPALLVSLKSPNPVLPATAWSFMFCFGLTLSPTLTLTVNLTLTVALIQMLILILVQCTCRRHICLCPRPSLSVVSRLGISLTVMLFIVVLTANSALVRRGVFC